MLTESEEYSEPGRIFKMEVFVKIVNGWKPLTISKKSSISDFRLGYEYTSVGEAREPIKKYLVSTLTFCGLFLTKIFFPLLSNKPISDSLLLSL